MSTENKPADNSIESTDEELKPGQLKYRFSRQTGVLDLNEIIRALPEDALPAKDDDEDTRNVKTKRLIEALDDVANGDSALGEFILELQKWKNREQGGKSLFNFLKAALTEYAEYYEDVDDPQESEEDEVSKKFNKLGLVLKTKNDEDSAEFVPKPVKNTGVKLKDIGGNKNVKKQAKGIIDMLRNPKRYALTGAQLYRGIMLVGPSGSGKTTLAKAIAGESKTPLIHVSAADFDAKYDGEGPARVTKLFYKAMKEIDKQRENGSENPKCMVFIDDIDLVASLDSDEENDYKMVSSKICQMMDVLDSLPGITVMAATSRPDTLEPSLVGSGRFEQTLELTSPDKAARNEILQIHINKKNMKLSRDVDLATIAELTQTLSGSQLQTLVNEAAVQAAKEGFSKDVRTRTTRKKHFMTAFHKVLEGLPGDMKLNKRSRELIAVHEAGHALAGLFMEEHGTEKFKYATILPHTDSSGFTYSVEDETSYGSNLSLYKAELVVWLAGRAAEELVYGKDQISSGAAEDIEEATTVATHMVKHWGYGEKSGLMRYGNDNSSEGGGDNKHPYVAKLIHDDIKGFLDDAYEQAKELLDKNHVQLLRFANALIEEEVIYRDRAIEITGFEPKSIQKPSLSKLLDRVESGEDISLYPNQDSGGNEPQVS